MRRSVAVHNIHPSHDDFSCDPSKWSWAKLSREIPHGMPAVIAERDRRFAEPDDDEDADA
jgi:hypothetical protein